MMGLLYNLSIRIFGIAIAIVSLFQEKARKWITGRRNWRKHLAETVKNQNEIIWVHCSSLGEFEQGRPVIEGLIANGEKVLLTFFSPSGYENKKNFPGVIGVHYLPLDTRNNARDFVEIVNPKVAIFVKYEFWFNYIAELHKRSTPLFLISGIFRPGQHFFKIYGAWFRKHLKMFSMLFVQDNDSLVLLENGGMQNRKLAGDTRFDRVNSIAESPKIIPVVEDFSNKAQCLIAGSTWHEDELLFSELLKEKTEIKLILAPHETDEVRLAEIEETFKDFSSIRLSKYSNETSARILIIDKIGLLSSLYRNALITYIGGGFGKGIHNTLEAAVYGKIIFFGPNYARFREARSMIEQGSAFSVRNPEEMLKIWDELVGKNQIVELGKKNASFVKENVGATELILRKLDEMNLLKKNTSPS